MSRVSPSLWLAAWPALGQVAVAATGFALLATCGRVLTPSDLGWFFLVLNAVLLLQNVMMSGPAAALARFIPSADGAAARLAIVQAVSVLVRRRALLCLGLGPPVAVAAILLGGLDPWAVALAMPIAVMQTGIALREGWLLGHGDQRSLALLQVAGLFLKPAAVAACCLLLLPGPLGAVLALALVATLTLAWQLRRVRVAELRDALAASASDGRVAGYAAPFLWWVLVAWAQQAAERWSLLACGGAEQVSHYGVAAMLGLGPATLLASVVTTATAPRIFAGPAECRGAEAGFWLRGMLIGLAVGTAVVLATWPWLTAIPSLLIGERYGASGLLLPLLLISGLCAGLAQSGSTVLLAADPRMLQASKIAAPLAGGALTLVLVPSQGVWGVVIGNLCGSAMQFACTAWSLAVLVRRRSAGIGGGR
jgi:O-antigen/teichoic acid export membrane protein